jgi:2-dehydropantoate 2-reductase
MLGNLGFPTTAYAVSVDSMILWAFNPTTNMHLTTKVNDNRTAAASIAEAIRDDTVILCIQNGLHGEDIVRSVIGERCLVLRAITQFGAIFQSPGIVNYTASGYTLLEDGPRSPAIAALLTACGLDGRVSPDIKTEIWRKLIYNCVINPITSITGTEVGGIADPRLDPLKRLVIDECLAVARTAGIEFAIDFLPVITETFSASRTIASMRQDLMRGRPTEIDHMNGAVAALGRRAGIDCPVNAALTAIIRAMDRCTMSA